MTERVPYDRPGALLSAAPFSSGGPEEPAAFASPSPSEAGLAGSIVRVRIPLPFPLRWVNSYLFPDSPEAGADGGWSLVDPGLRTPEAIAVWERVLAELDLKPAKLSRIVLTHHHPDHYGLAGWFQQRSGGAPVLLSPEGRRQVERLWGPGTPLAGETLRLFEQHGLADMRTHLESFLPQVSPQPELTELRAGECVRMGSADWLAIHTPGHAYGHLCLYQPEERLMLAGDHVLPRITPNIGFIPGEDGDPLGSYLSSLAEIARYPVRLALPGHRDPFPDLPGRAAEIARHHGERLAKMAAALAVPLSAAELCEAYFGKELTVHSLRFALSETIAHLIRLEALGLAEREERDGLIRYRACRVGESRK